jgi:hypothetical protein
MENSQCKKILSVLCNICGLYTPKSMKQVPINGNIEANYFRMFNRPILKDASYAPNFICGNCFTAINEKRFFRKVTAMLWNEPNEEHTDCYACLMPSLIGKKKDDRKKIAYPEYPNTNSIRVFEREEEEQERDRSPHPSFEARDTSPVYADLALMNNIEPQPGTSSMHEPTNVMPQSSIESIISTSTVVQQSSGELFVVPPPRNAESIPIKWTQEVFNDFCRDLGLTAEKSEIAGSQLNESNFLERGVNTTAYRTQKQQFASKFSNHEINLVIEKPTNNEDPDIDDDVDSDDSDDVPEITRTYNVAYVNDLEGLFQLFGATHNSNEWRLFLDGSSKSLKVVLLHNENTLPSVPVAYCKRLPEKYENMQIILNLIKYEQYKWEVIVDFKLINILTGLMAAASKYPCVHCLWDSKYAGSDKYTKTNWPERSNEINRKYNVVRAPLVPPAKILMPPLHIKIGLTTQLFKKIYQQNTEVIKVLKTMFPNLSDAKLKAGVYDGPQIREMFKKEVLLKQKMSRDEIHAFTCLQNVCEKFLGNQRARNYRQLVKDMITSYAKLNINITIKMHSLICHLDLFKDNCGAYSDEQGERFHQDLKRNEEDYFNMVNGLARYCWKIIRETNPDVHRRNPNYKRKMTYFYVNEN